MRTTTPLRIALEELKRPKHSRHTNWVYEGTRVGYRTYRPRRATKKQPSALAEFGLIVAYMVIGYMMVGVVMTCISPTY